MTLSWLASTNQGPMVGDYIATSILAGEAWGPFALASAQRRPLRRGHVRAHRRAARDGQQHRRADPVVSTSSDHATITVHSTAW